jgi:hypothetical protein
MNCLKLLCGLSLTVALGSTHAVVITFDDDNIPLSSPSDREIKDQVVYGGFEWSNFVYYDTRDGNGFARGLKSGNNVGYNMHGAPASFTSATAFTVNSLWATAGWRSGMNVSFLGYNQAGQLVQSRTVTPLESGPRLYVFDWVGLYKFGFSATGGTPVGEPDGTQVVLDNITVNDPLNRATEPDYTSPPPSTDQGTVPVSSTGGTGDTGDTGDINSASGTPTDINLPTTQPPGDPADLPSTTQTGAVPSPATFMLLGLGLLGLGAARYKRTLDRQSDCAQGK